VWDDRGVILENKINYGNSPFVDMDCTDSYINTNKAHLLTIRCHKAVRTAIRESISVSTHNQEYSIYVSRILIDTGYHCVPRIGIERDIICQESQPHCSCKEVREPVYRKLCIIESSTDSDIGYIWKTPGPFYICPTYRVGGMVLRTNIGPIVVDYNTNIPETLGRIPPLLKLDCNGIASDCHVINMWNQSDSNLVVKNRKRKKRSNWKYLSPICWLGECEGDEKGVAV